MSHLSCRISLEPKMSGAGPDNSESAMVLLNIIACKITIFNMGNRNTFSLLLFLGGGSGRGKTMKGLSLLLSASQSPFIRRRKKFFL